MANCRDPVSAKAYYMDDGVGYRVDITDAVATAGGFTASGSGLPYLPKHAKMRHIGLYNAATNKRGKVPFSNIAGAYLTGGTSFSFDGITWVVTGRIGEKVRL